MDGFAKKTANSAAGAEKVQDEKMRGRREKRKRDGVGGGSCRRDAAKLKTKKKRKPWPVSKKRACPVHTIRPSPDGITLNEETREEIRAFAQKSDDSIADLFAALKRTIIQIEMSEKICREKVFAVLICGYIFTRSAYFRELMIAGPDCDMRWFFNATCHVRNLDRSRTMREESAKVQNAALREFDKWHDAFGSRYAKMGITYRWVRARMGKAALDAARATDPTRVAKERKERENRACVARFRSARNDMLSVESELNVVLKSVAQCFRLLMPHFERRESRLPPREREPVVSREVFDRGFLSSAPTIGQNMVPNITTASTSVRTEAVDSRKEEVGEEEEDDDDEWEEVNVELPKTASERQEERRSLSTSAPREHSHARVQDIMPHILGAVAPSSSIGSARGAQGAEDLDTWAREHGMAVSTYRKRIDVGLVVGMSDDNECVIRQLRDLRKEVERHYLPKIVAWLALVGDVKKIRDECADGTEKSIGLRVHDVEHVESRLQNAQKHARTIIQRCSTVRVLKRGARGNPERERERKSPGGDPRGVK